MELPTPAFVDIVAVFSAVAALLAALYASLQARHAAKTVELAQIEFGERHATMQAELIDGVSFENKDGKRVVAIACNLINRAAAPNSVASIELHLHQFGDDGAASKLVLKLVGDETPPLWGLQPFPNPLNLAERSTISGWASFRIPDNFATRRTVDKYEMVFRDSQGGRAAIELHLLRRVELA